MKRRESPIGEEQRRGPKSRSSDGEYGSSRSKRSRSVSRDRKRRESYLDSNSRKVNSDNFEDGYDSGSHWGEQPLALLRSKRVSRSSRRSRSRSKSVSRTRRRSRSGSRRVSQTRRSIGYRSRSRHGSYERPKSKSRSQSPEHKIWNKQTSVTTAGWKESVSESVAEQKALECKLKDMSPEEIEMMKVMGFCNFDSTNGRQVEGNMTDAVFQNVSRRKYRQYMNRKGGFNRPLDFTL